MTTVAVPEGDRYTPGLGLRPRAGARRGEGLPEPAMLVARPVARAAFQALGKGRNLGPGRGDTWRSQSEGFRDASDEFGVLNRQGVGMDL